MEDLVDWFLVLFVVVYVSLCFGLIYLVYRFVRKRALRWVPATKPIEPESIRRGKLPWTTYEEIHAEIRDFFAYFSKVAGSASLSMMLNIVKVGKSNEGGLFSSKGQHRASTLRISPVQTDILSRRAEYTADSSRFVDLLLHEYPYEGLAQHLIHRYPGINWSTIADLHALTVRNAERIVGPAQRAFLAITGVAVFVANEIPPTLIGENAAVFQEITFVALMGLALYVGFLGLFTIIPARRQKRQYEWTETVITLARLLSEDPDAPGRVSNKTNRS